MGVQDDIQAAAEDPRLTPNERRRRVAELRGNAWYSTLDGRLPLTVTTPKGQLTIRTATWDGTQLTMTGNGVITDWATPDDSWEWVVVNPPLLVPDAVRSVRLGDNTRWRFDPLAALAQAAAELARE